MTFPGAETIKGGANGVDILRLYAGRGSLRRRLGESESLLDEFTRSCPLELAVFMAGECLGAPLRISRIPLAVVIVHAQFTCSVASRQRELNYGGIDRRRMTARSL